MAVIQRGGNAPLSGAEFDIVLQWTDGPGRTHDIDLCGLLLGPGGKVRSEDDFVFYNHPAHTSGAVAHRGRSGTVERMAVDLTRLPADVATIVLVASISNGTFAAAALSLSIAAASVGEQLRFDDMGASSETAFVVGELYLREGRWKFRAVGQGWDSGLAGVATAYGVDVAGEPAPTATTQAVLSPAATSDAPTAAPTSGRAGRRGLAPPPPEESAPATTPTGTPVPTQAAAPVPAPTDGTGRAGRRGLTPPAPSSTPAVPAGQPAATARASARPRIAASRPPAGTPSLDEPALTLSVGQALSLLHRGATPDSLWLRVTHTSAEGAVPTDVSITAHDEFGAPRNVVYYGESDGAGGTIRLLNKPTSSAAEDTAAVEVKLSSIDASIAALVLAATSYGGRTLDPNRAFVIDLVAPDGTVHARTECVAPATTGILLLAIRRDSTGAWVLTPLARPAAGRTAKSVVGAAQWALTA